jgi:hypothetical protein
MRKLWQCSRPTTKSLIRKNKHQDKYPNWF